MQVEYLNSHVDGELTEQSLRQKLVAQDYLVTRYSYVPGTYFPAHRHEVDKIDAVLSGQFKITMLDQSVVLKAGDSLIVSRDVMHSA